MKYILAFVLFLVGCVAEVQRPFYDDSKPVFLTLHGDTSFTNDERKSILSATKAWDDQTGGLAVVTIVFDRTPGEDTEGQNVLMRLTSDNPEVVAEQTSIGCEHCLLGWANKIGPFKTGEPSELRLVIDNIKSMGTADPVREVTMHEIGHLLGLVHIPQQWAIMYPYANADQRACLTQADLADFCTANVCGSHKLYPCD